MTNQEAIATINANYPDERYTMLREALHLAIEALKEREPRVLTLEEVKNIKGKAFFLENRVEVNGETRRTWWSWGLFRKVDFSKKLNEEYFVFADDRHLSSDLHYPVSEYGKEWRCWSGQPSDSERGNTPWEN